MRKDESIRWTKEKAASEFGINPRTLTARIRKYGIESGKDGNYSTKDICSAVFGDIDSEKLRLTREQADKAAMENAETRGELANVKDLAVVTNRAIAAVKARIDSASNLEREDKDKILVELGKLWDGAFGVSSTDAPDLEPAAAV